NTFRRSEAEATQIMLHIHQNGMGVAGIYSKQIAETKAEKAMKLAEENNFPLQCTFEEA
ncbi:MAG: ATP-dependent Clp protease adaptor protein ClpS, partial [Cognaticolwellia sp.]